ncbi:terminase gpA endonuclease subunit [Alienimonas sp. DA493]|uniref:terminase gpA endonuclease subunit n=1 Tax=Alienimonas sp. DA493 TaxID=3373605 RepID=UPI0037553DBA
MSVAEAPPLTGADRHRDRMARRSRQAFAAVSDIGEIPPIVDPERRESCRLDLHRFLRTYFPQSTGLAPFGEAQVRAISRIEHCILRGGRFLNLMPRGFVKSTIGENSELFAALYGHRRYGVFFGASKDDAEEAIDSIKVELQENDLLYEDFPEVCHAIRALEGKPQRAASQTQGGVLTHIEWTADTVVLPTIFVPEGWGDPSAKNNMDRVVRSPASGAIIRTKGLLSASRGMRYKRADGTQARPDYVVIDDPQTDESAASPTQVEKRLNVIRKSVLRLGGHGRQVAAVMNATAIAEGDVPQTLGDPEKHPEWETERVSMMVSMPTALETHWLGEYAKIRQSYDRDTPGDRDRAVRESTAYYEANRAAMDAGAAVAWEHIPLEASEVSAIQHAMNILVDDGEDVFDSECQNNPKREAAAGVAALSSEDIAKKVSPEGRGVVPESASHVVFHIDVHDSLLYWTVAAVAEDFSGGPIDYGVFPEQPNDSFTLRSARRTLSTEYESETIEGALTAGIADLLEKLCGRRWATAGGMEYDATGLIDSGYKPELVASAVRRSPYASRVFAAHGIPLSPGETLGGKNKPGSVVRAWPAPTAARWYEPRNPPHGLRRIYFDANYWKDFVQARFAASPGTPGGWELYGGRGHRHAVYAAHLTSQQPVPTTARGSTVNVYKLKPKREDHWLDTAVGCAIAASVAGCRRPTDAPAPPIVRPPAPQPIRVAAPGLTAGRNKPFFAQRRR